MERSSQNTAFEKLKTCELSVQHLLLLFLIFVPHSSFSEMSKVHAAGCSLLVSIVKA